MTLIEQIKADHECELGKVWDSVPMHIAEDSPHVLTAGGLIVATTYNDKTARRIARVPDMEEALLAADALIDEIFRLAKAGGCNGFDECSMCQNITDVISAYRKATGP